MPKDFENRVALVTGGAGAGIGSHSVRRLANDGASVAVVDIHERRCRTVADEIAKETGARVLPFPGDIADRERMKAVIAEIESSLGPVDVLVNNAAENVLAPIREFAMDDWDRVLDVDLTAAFHLTRILLPGMIERRRGAIVNISSIAGWLGDANEGREAPYVRLREVRAVRPHAQRRVRRRAVRRALQRDRTGPHLVEVRRPLRRAVPPRHRENAAAALRQARRGCRARRVPRVGPLGVHHGRGDQHQRRLVHAAMIAGGAHA
jgi:hypothetical protein